MPEKSRTEYSRVRLHRMGSPLERNDDIFLYQDGHIEVKISSSEGSGFFVFEAEQALTDALLDYLFNSLNFFALNNTYDEEEAAPAKTGVQE